MAAVKAHPSRHDARRPVVAHRETREARTTPVAVAVTHANASLAFYTEGRSRLEQNGEWTIRAGDVVLVPAGMPHRMLESQKLTYWGLSFCVSCVVAHGGAALVSPFERVRDGGAAVVRIPPDRHAYLETLFRELAEAGYPGQGEVNAIDAVQRSLLTLILAEVERAAQTGAATSATQGSAVADALRYIERHCLEKLTLAAVAAAVQRTPAYLTTAIARATGRTAGEWIVAGRLAEARRLLLHSEEKIDVIAARVGYADVTHFIRMFRREHGATPAAWRAAQLGVTARPRARAPRTARR